MPPSVSRLLEFPDGMSPATSGVVVEDGRTLITGHKNGYVARWSLGFAVPPTVILRAASTVYALAPIRGGGLFVGSQAGDLHLFKNFPRIRLCGFCLLQTPNLIVYGGL